MLIAVANLKGGCGKSTCAVNLACELAGLDHLCTDRWQGKCSVVLVDADAKGTATRYCSGGYLPVSSEHLPLGDLKELKQWIGRIVAIEVDYVVVDGPPQVGAVTKAMIGISDLVVVPCSASTADLVATAPMMELIRTARSTRSDGGPRCLLVPTRVDARTKAGRGIETALRRFGEPVGPVIHQSVAFVGAFSAGRWIGDFAPNSAAHGDIKALAARVTRTEGKEMSSKKRSLRSFQATEEQG